MKIFVSKLVVNTSHPKVQKDLINMYEMHKTLHRAFPNVSDRTEIRLLFRVERLRMFNQIAILTQSKIEPNWSALDRAYLVSWEVKEVSSKYQALTNGDLVKFKLKANPTKRLTAPIHKRVGLSESKDLLEWLGRKAEKCGFSIKAVSFKKDAEIGYKHSSELKFSSVIFEGMFEITNVELFLESVRAGIGSAKGFGFGLVSIARI
jgi:CRISPR system Cascade subunit CasE